MGALHTSMKIRLVESALLLLAITAGGLAQAAGPAGETSDSFEFRSGVLVDPDRALCYLMNAGAGIDALDLRSGKAIWTTALAQKPLLLLGSTLVAQAEPGERGNVLRLVLLDTEKSGALTARMDVDLPSGVRAAIDDGPGTRFRVEAWALPYRLAVAWSYSEAPVRGELDVSQLGSGGFSMEGGARIDLETGAVHIAAPGDKPEVPKLPLPPTLAELKASGRLGRSVWRSGDTYIAALRARQDGPEQTVLKRWRAATGESLPDVTLLTERYTLQYPSADQRHMLVSRFEHSPPAPVCYEWLVFSLTTGDRIAELRLDFPQAWFFVSGPLLVHEVRAQAQLVDGAWTQVPPKLRAIDLQTGGEQWTWLLRDTAYRGSLPPGTH